MKMHHGERQGNPDDATRLLRAGGCQLLVVDVQERLIAAMPAPEARRAEAGLGLLAAATDALGVPVTITEHAPDAIGGTAASVRAAFPAAQVVEKLHFSAADEPALPAHLDRFDRRDLIVCGMETHVCVLETALGLRQHGYRVALAVDACACRSPFDAEIALQRAAWAGILPVTTDMIAFEWLRRADHPARRRIIEAVKAKDALNRPPEQAGRP